ncbi:MAG: aminopeptidase P family protein [Salibacteraceae bacterium]|jgi:Xaa-Pro dipeptidase|nr:aminopeptidase P family protein [Salibacteraceae bacterium]MDP4688067.1 aminopeptidase P family protein [Salibacteraceae bacterium]
MNQTLQNLIAAEQKAAQLFSEIEARGMISAGKTEKELNTDVYDLALEMFGISKYWHKRIVRAGKNTLAPYDENPPNLILQNDDIVFLDFGPVFDEWEADFGRTYVVGNDAKKHKLKQDIELAWKHCRDYFLTQTSITGAQYFDFAVKSAAKFGWEFGGPIAGHLIGHFPHERLDKEDKTNYIHPDNQVDMFAPDTEGNKREWILEIHFIDASAEIGGFFEQVLV